MTKLAPTSELVGYDEDYQAWVVEQIELLKAGRFSDHRYSAEPVSQEQSILGRAGSR
jgi:hypothetical protein